MKCLNKITLAAILLIPNISGADFDERDYSAATKLAIKEGVLKKESQRALRETIIKFEKQEYYDEVLERTGRPPIYNQEPVILYQTKQKTITITDYPKQGMDIIINLEKEKDYITYDLSEDILKNLKRGKNEDFPTTDWTTIKRGNKLRIIMPEREKEFLDKTYKKARLEYLEPK